MLRMYLNPVEIGTTFELSDVWKEKLTDDIGVNSFSFPTRWRITEIDDHVCYCEPIPYEWETQEVKISVSKHIVRYLNAKKVPDAECGVYLHDYFPEVNDKVLFVNQKYDDFMPAKLILDIVVDDIPYLDLLLQDLLTFETHSLASRAKYSWKHLISSNAYMTRVERLYKETFVHKGFVEAVCRDMSQWLREHGMNKEAEQLLVRARVHDNSKLCDKKEREALVHMANNKASLRDAKTQLTESQEDALEYHWKNNRHHPEHFENYDDMSTVDRLEMACDWMARSIQYNSDLLEFIETRQQERFHFSEQMYEEVLIYCNALVDMQTRKRATVPE